MCEIGGGESSSGSNSSSKSGFALLPKEMQDAWKQYASQVGNQFSGSNANLFKLPTLNAGATGALNLLSNGAFSPTAGSIKSDIAMQTNPFDSSVIDTINREAQGSGSVLKQSLDSAGQFGSNRANLGANDIDLTRLNQIGTFKNNEFNTAMQNALTTLPQARTTAAQNAVTAGQAEQGQTYQNQQAPISALQSYGQLAGVLPTSGGSVSGSQSESQSVNGSI